MEPEIDKIEEIRRSIIPIDKFEEAIGEKLLKLMREGLTLTSSCEQISEETNRTFDCPTIFRWLRDPHAKIGERRFLAHFKEAEEDRRMKWEDLAMLELRHMKANMSANQIALAKARSAMYRQGAKESGIEILTKADPESNVPVVIIRKFMPTIEQD